MNPEVDVFISKSKKWQEEFEQLRMIVLDCGLTEELKWMHPCYTFEKSNIVLIHGFKEYCALLFHKGALLNDAKGILIQQTENVQAARQIRFTNVDEIVEMEPILKAYIKEAIEVEKAGLEVNYKKTTEFIFPEEFQKKLDEIPSLKTAFEILDARTGYHGNKAWKRTRTLKKSEFTGKLLWSSNHRSKTNEPTRYILPQY